MSAVGNPTPVGALRPGCRDPLHRKAHGAVQLDRGRPAALDPDQHRVERISREREPGRGRRAAEAPDEEIEDVVRPVPDADAGDVDAVQPRDRGAQAGARRIGIEPEGGAAGTHLADDGLPDPRARGIGAFVRVQLDPTGRRGLQPRRVGMELRDMGEREPPRTRAAHGEPAPGIRIETDRPWASRRSMAENAATVGHAARMLLAS